MKRESFGQTRNPLPMKLLKREAKKRKTTKSKIVEELIIKEYASKDTR